MRLCEVAWFLPDQQALFGERANPFLKQIIDAAMMLKMIKR